MAGFPIEVDLEGRLVVVVGLGAVGRRRAEGLLEAGAQVVGVDPCPPGDDLVSRIDYRNELYRSYQLTGAFLVFASATPEVNSQIVKDAKICGVLVNSASHSDLADFSIPAIWRNGGVLLAVSTKGASPALASALRDRAAEAIGEAAAGLAAVLAEVRPIVLARVTDPEVRRRILSDWADPRWIEIFARGGADAVRAELERRLSGC